MDIFNITLKTSLKIANGVIIPAGKQYSGTVSELPKWLIPEIESDSSALSITVVPDKVSPLIKVPISEIVEPSEEILPSAAVPEKLVTRKSIRRSKSV